MSSNPPPPPSQLPLLPVGIDLGSLHARVAAGDPVAASSSPSASSSPFSSDPTKNGSGGGARRPPPPSLPSVVRNAQGGRYTLAASAAEFRADHEEVQNGNSGGNKDDKKKESYVFGEAARQSLHRARKPLERSLVRHLSSLGADDSEGGEDEGGGVGEEVDGARLASSAFFAHLVRLVCDASSVRPSQIRLVLNAPAGVDGDADTDKVVRGAAEAAERGLAEAVAEEEEKERAASGGKKKRKKKKDDEGSRVVSVIGDAAAVAVAHGLTGPGGATSASLGAAPQSPAADDGPNNNGDGAPADWSHALIVDWGASSLTLSALSNPGGTGTLQLVRTTRDSSCSGRALSSLLVNHCASQFERRNRLPSGEVLASKRAKGRLERACEDALRTLGAAQGGSRAGCSVVVDGLYEGLDLNVPVSRPRFDALCGPFYRKAKAMIQAEAARLAEKEGEGGGGAAAFDAVLAAGNVSLMPGAAAVVDGLFPPKGDDKKCWRGRSDVPADEAVALGCAMQCGYALRCRPELGAPTSSGDDEDDYFARRPVTEEVLLCPVRVGICILDDDGSCGSEDDTVTLVDVGAPLPANVTRTISLNGGGGVILGLVQLPPAGSTDGSPKLLARIEDAADGGHKEGGVEVTLEITAEGKLTLAVNGGESVTL